ncbi:MAG: hypothetical protein CMQ28_03465 [Gammaproteobacteria bacterium]|nr:hypothetical protein [Gammaproteobacteria bacterium]
MRARFQILTAQNGDTEGLLAAELSRQGAARAKPLMHLKGKRKKPLDMNRVNSKLAIATLAALGLQGQFVFAQEDDADNSVTTDSDTFASFRIAPTSVLSEAAAPLFEIQRNLEARDIQGHVVEDALNFNLGLEITPIEGLNIRADAWQQEINEVPGNSTRGPENNLPQLYIEDSAINEFNIANPFIGSNLESSGFDIGASYVWDTNRFGQFTLSTKTTYVQNFENNDSLLELITVGLGDPADRVVSPELQSNLMLTWEFGNHTATAITNYFDSFKDISELDLDEINALVDDIITVDLQYGYSVETGNNDRAIISFGIRNIFNEKTAQILNSNTRILDQNGRVAYGSIKYQF